MSWTTWYLTAPDEAAAKAAALESGRALLDEKGDWILSSATHAFDPGILVITAPPVLNPDGSLETPARRAPGWFANLRVRAADDVSGLLAAAAAHGVEITHPATPARDFA